MTEFVLCFLFVFFVCGYVFVYKYFHQVKETKEEESEQSTSLPKKVCTSMNCDWECIRDETLESGEEKIKIIYNKCHSCGALDKTIERVGVKSKTWITVSEKTMPSAYEQMNSLQRMNLSSYPEWIFQKKYILVQKCKETGEIKETIVFSDKSK